MESQEENALMRDIGRLLEFMQRSVALREEDRAQRIRRQAQADARHEAQQKRIERIEHRIAEMTTLYRVVKYILGLMFLLLTLRFGDIPHWFKEVFT